MSSTAVPVATRDWPYNFSKAGLQIRMCWLESTTSKPSVSAARTARYFGRVFRNLAVELALAGQQLFQGQPDPAGLGGAAEEKGRRLFASPNSR